MQLIDDLRAEHDLIERVVGAFRTFVDRRLAGEADPGDGPRFLAFFRLFAGRFHHAREEDALFVALERDAELPADRGPMAVMREDHRRMAGLLDAMEPLLAGDLGETSARETLAALAREYSRSLWHHIDAENSVLLPESEERLRRHGIRELPSREMTGAEREARAAGEALLARYPPLDDPAIIRGDGCVFCLAFGNGCRGLEHEWWNESEWEEFENHLPSE
jgi:hemerythrin-like domain-containing protein